MQEVPQSAKSPPKKKMKPEEDSPCVHCDFCPCILEQGLYDLLSEGVSLLEDDGHDIHAIRRQVRYDMYRKASNFIFGRLGKGIRKKLPDCVVSEIRDFVPENDKTSYVGFREAPTL
jgi:hypothetical protein